MRLPSHKEAKGGSGWQAEHSQLPVCLFHGLHFQTVFQRGLVNQEGGIFPWRKHGRGAGSWAGQALGPGFLPSPFPDPVPCVHARMTTSCQPPLLTHLDQSLAGHGVPREDQLPAGRVDQCTAISMLAVPDLAGLKLEGRAWLQRRPLTTRYPHCPPPPAAAPYLLQITGSQQ